MGQKLRAEATPSLLVRVLFRVFEAMNCGGILLDQDKRVLHANGPAQKALTDSFTSKSGRLHAADRASDILFQTVLDQALTHGSKPGQRRRQALGLKRADKRPLIVRAVPVDPAARTEIDGAAIVLMLVDPEDCAEPSDSMLQQVFGMTKAEARVANRIMCGASLQEIAEATDVSVGTVRSQTKALFAKTGTHRQSELVGLLTRLAMISEGE